MLAAATTYKIMPSNDFCMVIICKEYLRVSFGGGGERGLGSWLTMATNNTVILVRKMSEKGV